MNSTWLKGALPGMGLLPFAHHFIDKLSGAEFEKLRSLAKGLDGFTIPVGSTCSGLATFGLCVKALFEAISQRFDVEIKVSSEFAVEIDPKKQQFILSSQGDELKHLFSDVSGFQKKTAFCLKHNKTVPIPKVFLLGASPSCVNLSGQRNDRAAFASSYMGEDDHSGFTYQYGYKQAIQRCDVKVSIYENVRDASHSLKDENGVQQTPATTIIKDDLKNLGHVFEFSKLDTCNFLLPQRRERVWGSSCKGEDDLQYTTRMRVTMQRFRSPHRIPLASILDPALPQEELSNQRVQGQAQKVEKMCAEKNLKVEDATFDLAGSAGRLPEWSHDALTCVRPTHRIWSMGRNRRVAPQEMLKAHGVFAWDFPNKEALDNLEPTLAHDCAGNAFQPQW